MPNITVLSPVHTSFDTAYLIDNYPYGGHRTQMKMWIESKQKFGQRVMTCTLNPKTGKWNKPKAGNYWLACVLFIDHEDKDHVKNDCLSEYDTKKAGEFLETYGAGMTPYYQDKLLFYKTMHIVQDTHGIQLYGATPEVYNAFWDKVKELLGEIDRQDLISKIK